MNDLLLIYLLNLISTTSPLSALSNALYSAIKITVIMKIIFVNYADDYLNNQSC